MIRIRLRRVGKKRHASYRMVVANQPAKRDGAFLEILGSYDPHAVPPLATLDEGRTRDWLSKGAMPSEAAAKILRRAGIIGSSEFRVPSSESRTTKSVAAPAVGVEERPAEAEVEVVAEEPAVEQTSEE